MADFVTDAKVEVSTRMTLSEDELAALATLSSYGLDTFVEVFYKHLGRAYMEEHELGLRKLLASAAAHYKSVKPNADRARAAFKAGGR